MDGWRWCPGADDHCHECRRRVTGLWRYFVGLVAQLSVCGKCAGGTVAA